MTMAPRKRKWTLVWPEWLHGEVPKQLRGLSTRTRGEAIAHAEKLCAVKWPTLYRRGMRCLSYLGGPIEVWERPHAAR